jgi:hypothetical protein
MFELVQPGRDQPIVNRTVPQPSLQDKALRREEDRPLRSALRPVSPQTEGVRIQGRLLAAPRIGAPLSWIGRNGPPQALSSHSRGCC